MRILGIDPALRNAGYGVIEGGPNRPVWLCHGVIRSKPNIPQSRCLVAIRDQLAEVILKFEPDVCAVEGIIYVQSHRTAISMGAARAAVLIAAAEAGLPILEYAPKRVKQSVVGRGAADKGQVAFMVRALLRLTETPDHDAADALAVALTHLNAASRPTLEPPTHL